MKRRGNNEGSIFQTKSGAWVAQIHLGYKENGKAHYKRIQRKTRKEALKLLEEVKQQLRYGVFINKNNLGFNDWIKEYLENYCKHSVRQTTFDKYETLARVHIYPYFAGYKLQEIKTNDIQRFIADKTKTKATSTVREIRLIINKALQQAVKEKLISENVAMYTSLPRIEEKEVLPLDEKSLKNLLNVAKQHRLYYALTLLISTGIRRGELLGLQWKDIDFDTGTIKIVRSFVKTKAGNIIQETKTKSSKRIINVPNYIMQILYEAKRKSIAENPWIVSVEHQRKNTEYLPLAPRNFSRTYATWCKKAGIENIKIHTLRHTYASLALAMNVHMKIVQAQLGHANIKVTMDRYSHLMPSIQQEAATKMNAKLSEILPK